MILVGPPRLKISPEQRILGVEGLIHLTHHFLKSKLLTYIVFDQILVGGKTTLHSFSLWVSQRITLMSVLLPHDDTVPVFNGGD